MSFHLGFSEEAMESLRHIDPTQRNRIVKWLEKNVTVATILAEQANYLRGIMLDCGDIVSETTVSSAIYRMDCYWSWSWMWDTERTSTNR